MMFRIMVPVLFFALLGAGCGKKKEQKDQVFTLQTEKKAKTKAKVNKSEKVRKNLTLEDKRKSEEELFAEAEKFFQKKDYAKAVGAYEKYLAVYPEATRRYDAQYNIGYINYKHVKIYSDALVRFNKVLEENPNYPDSDKLLFYTCDIYQRQRKTIKALNSAQELLRKHPKSPFVKDCLWVLATIYQNEGNFQDAEVTLNKLIKLAAPGYSDRALFELGRYQEETLLKHRDAIVFYKRIIDEYPKSKILKEATNKFNKINEIIEEEKKLDQKQKDLLANKRRMEAERRQKELAHKNKVEADKKTHGRGTSP